MLKIDKVFVIHVKKGYDDRATHMEKMLSRMGIEFEYMLDGDISDISDSDVEEFFAGDMAKKNAATSCAMKHLLVYKKMIEENLDKVLVLEDDVILVSNFITKFNQSIDELGVKHPENDPYMAFYEATHMKFIPRSKRKKGIMLYKPRLLQCTATYTVNKSHAIELLGIMRERKCDVPIDVFIDNLYLSGVMPNLYQSHPDLSVQCSHTGKMKSSIGNKLEGRFMANIRRKFSYRFKKYIIYNLR